MHQRKDAALFFVANDLCHHVADGFEALGTAFVRRIFERVPVGVVEVDEVDGGDTGVVEGDMVVADGVLQAVGELGTVAERGGSGPYFVIQVRVQAL